MDKLEIVKCKCGHQDCDKFHLNTGYVHGFDKNQAQLICDAVNNTADAGIDPNAVPGLLKALEIISQHAYDDDTPKGDILADFDNMRGLAVNAIKSAELK